MNAHSLKPKHVETLVERWLAENLASGTIKNRMSALRWWAQKIGKENVIARTNTAYAIAIGVFVTNVSKARDRDPRQLSRIQDLRIRISLRLQALFGLRREESIKIIPAWADRGDRPVLKDSWTKGGRPREIPIRTREQRQPQGGQGHCRGQESRRARLHDLSCLPAAFPQPVRSGWNLRLSRPSPRLRPDPVPGADRLAVPGARRPRIPRFQPRKKVDRPPGQTHDQPRVGPQPRINHRRVLGSLTPSPGRELAAWPPDLVTTARSEDAARRAKDDVGSRPLIALASDYGNYVHRPIGGAWCVGQHEGSNFRWRWSCAD